MASIYASQAFCINHPSGKINVPLGRSTLPEALVKHPDVQHYESVGACRVGSKFGDEPEEAQRARIRQSVDRLNETRAEAMAGPDLIGYRPITNDKGDPVGRFELYRQKTGEKTGRSFDLEAEAVLAAEKESAKAWAAFLGQP